MPNLYCSEHADRATFSGSRVWRRVAERRLACCAMCHLITTIILLFALVPGVAYAKRIPAPKVEPVVYGGVRYVAPNDNGRRGYIQAWDVATNKMLWSVTIFRNFINPFLEEDVQWVYIKTLRIDDGRLTVTDERDRAYSVDLKTHSVKRLRKVPSFVSGAVLIRSNQPGGLAEGSRGRSAAETPGRSWVRSGTPPGCGKAPQAAELGRRSTPIALPAVQKLRCAAAATGVNQVT